MKEPSLGTRSTSFLAGRVGAELASRRHRGLGKGCHCWGFGYSRELMSLWRLGIGRS